MNRTCLLVLLTGWTVLVHGAAPPEESNDLQLRKAKLEVQKLELEVAQLNTDSGEFQNWIVGVGGILAGVVGTFVSIFLARRTRQGELDLSVHEKRLEIYPKLVEAGGPLAIYFASEGSSAWAIDVKECRKIGHAMSKWYFGGGGLILSTEAREAYFKLARALTRASLAESLKVPVFPRDAESISVEKLKAYRAELDIKDEPDDDDIKIWKFGLLDPKNETLAQEFRDYVFLQNLSSSLRTRLSEDLRSRRRPS